MIAQRTNFTFTLPTAATLTGTSSHYGVKMGQGISLVITRFRPGHNKSVVT